MALWAALVYQAHRPDTFRNQPFRQTVAQLGGVSTAAYTPAQASYDLRRLRLKGVIERIPHTHTYQLTELGLKVATFLTKLYERLFRPGLASALPDPSFPSDLAQALDTVRRVVDEWVRKASFVPAPTMA